MLMVMLRCKPGTDGIEIATTIASSLFLLSVSTTSALGADFNCRPKSLPPTEFNFDGGQLNLFNRSKPVDASHRGKLALSAVARGTDEFTIRFQKSSHSRDVNGCLLQGGNTRSTNGSYVTYTYFADFPEGEYVN